MEYYYSVFAYMRALKYMCIAHVVGLHYSTGSKVFLE